MSSSEITCIVSGDRGQRETGWFGSVSTSSGGNIMLITLFAKLKASNQFYKDSQTTLRNNYSAHVYLKQLTMWCLNESNLTV